MYTGQSDEPLTVKHHHCSHRVMKAQEEQEKSHSIQMIINRAAWEAKNTMRKINYSSLEQHWWDSEDLRLVWDLSIPSSARRHVSHWGESHFFFFWMKEEGKTSITQHRLWQWELHEVCARCVFSQWYRWFCSVPLVTVWGDHAPWADAETLYPQAAHRPNFYIF